MAVAELNDASVPKASGEVELPLHIRWSGSAITYNLSDRADRARVYEQVLREGTEADIRYYVQADRCASFSTSSFCPHRSGKPRPVGFDVTHEIAGSTAGRARRRAPGS